MNPKKATKTDETTLANAMRFMFKNMKSGDTIYLAFSRRNFYVLIFVMGMSVIANAVLVDLLVSAPTIVQKADTPISVAQLILSLLAIVAGFWLFLKGILIVTER
jgi:lysylphosphatidylglycerol synthetase-like protein (DUF2156 family)